MCPRTISGLERSYCDTVRRSPYLLSYVCLNSKQRGRIVALILDLTLRVRIFFENMVVRLH